ncbi:GyrI-like domain-containing protein [Bacillus sp. FSL W8-0920]|uniref:GyrI-like domain-containing protein n=1 Tax=Bacillus TaxID=1386 RepID=UPI0010BEF156|nr:GyrI-like domain-containing protein [Bacillus pumilus]MBR0590620.1 DNA gyrase inhibitor [Bacillus pumilus sxm20-2]MCM3148650.1 GyrI-like domain-containing protein [Bacillus pumilus]MCP1530560.1 DNA gyrase inhibitor GyrI [Bacillus pumilus]MCY7435107.1 GyrI-like domain-containing protein [Bacillus pumilus]MDF9785956.1 DNA gyrase inhibitor GyrI [Bacillus pumilus]
MNYKIEMLTNMKMVFMRNIGPYGSKENVEMMKRFKKWINQHQLNDELKEFGIYGVPQDDPGKIPPEKCRYDLMLMTNRDFSKDRMVQTGHFEGGKYAVFTVTHTTEKVNLFWSQLPQMIQNNQLNMRQASIMERYREEEGVCEFLLPIF